MYIPWVCPEYLHNFLVYKIHILDKKVKKKSKENNWSHSIALSWIIWKENSVVLVVHNKKVKNFPIEVSLKPFSLNHIIISYYYTTMATLTQNELKLLTIKQLLILYQIPDARKRSVLFEYIVQQIVSAIENSF